jgi:transcriptional regulator with XRE-family HTH domain
MQRTRRRLTYKGLLIKNRLMELNMTQKDLAGRLQMNSGYLTDIIRGRRSGEKYMDRIFSELNIDGKEKYGSENLIDYGKID